MPTLDELESRLQSLLEVHLVKFLPGYKVEDGMAQQLAATLHRNLKEVAGVAYAPNLFMIVAHPSTLARWRERPRLLKELANALHVAGMEAGFQFMIKPSVTTAGDALMPSEALRIIASFSGENIGETQGISTGNSPDPAPGNSPGNAFLIVGGSRIIPLSNSVVNIGRRMDNHIVIDDPRVSRIHAQLRTVKGQFMLFDLNSSGGTFLNGQRTNHSVLHPGDVISLAGVSLIFSQDLPESGSTGDGQTEPGPSSSVDPSPVSISRKNDIPK
jgi:hypothetical protein